MRHFIRYNANGELTGVDTRGFGWPEHVDPRDPDSTDSVAVLIRTMRENPIYDFVDWVEYRCGCAKQPVSCSCANKMLGGHYYNGVVLFPKPAMSVEIAGAEASLTDPNDYPAGSTVELVLRGFAPDGHVVEISNLLGVYEMLPSATPVTFTDGVTPPVQLSVPPQGVVGGVVANSKYVRAFMCLVRGWG